MAGLLDQYILADNAQALEMTKWMADYFYNRVQNVITTYSVERHWYSLNEETGGMNDVLYKLFMVTVGNQSLIHLLNLFLINLFDCVENWKNEHISRTDAASFNSFVWVIYVFISLFH